MDLRRSRGAASADHVLASLTAASMSASLAWIGLTLAAFFVCWLRAELWARQIGSG
jgi:hypothetical protein